MPPTGYSGTPLSKKLGLTPGCRVVIKHAPDDYRTLLDPLPPDVVFESTVSHATDIIHIFAERQNDLKAELITLRTAIRSNAVVWVSWPKKTSKVSTDITEDVIRDLALPLGFVDIKVCAVNAIWSGLKLMIRKELR